MMLVDGDPEPAGLGLLLVPLVALLSHARPEDHPV
jgi:hypothetical protein